MTYTKTQINGTTQILPNSIPWSALNGGAIVPLTAIAGGSQIILSTGTVTMGANLSMGGYTITNSGSPINGSDLVTKTYVDNKVSGFEIFGATVLSSTNIATLSGLLVVDGHTTVAGNIVLLIAQTTGSQNGPWVVSASTWVRPSWWSTGSVIPPGTYFLTDSYGTTYKNTKWWMTTVGTITVDTTTITFVQDLSGTNYTTGSGITLSGNAFSAKVGNGLSIGSGSITAVGSGIISVGSSGIGISNSSAGGQVILGNASDTPTWTTISGDMILGATGVVTLTTVNANTGTFGAGNAIPTFTVNNKGLITAAGTTAVVAPAGTLSGTALAVNVVSSSLTNVGILNTLSVSGVTTLTTAPVFTALTGFVYANGSGATTANTKIPSSALNYSVEETPSGTLNGTNTAFTLAHAPVVNLGLYLNGVLLRQGASYDYTTSSTAITMNYAPLATDWLLVSYLY